MSITSYFEDFNIDDFDIQDSKRFRNTLKLLNACKDGNLDIISWLLYFDYELNTSKYNDLAFCIACENNNLEIAQLIYKNKPEIKFEKHFEYIVYNSIEEEYFELFKWIYSVFHHYILTLDINSIFRLACDIDSLEIAEFLYITNFNINNKIVIDIFINACDNNNLALAELLVKTKPNRFYINIIEEKIVQFEIINILVIENNINSNKIVDKLKLFDDCPICYSNKPNVITKCNHLFCFNCIEKHYEKNNMNCPYCRETNFENDLQNIIN